MIVAWNVVDWEITRTSRIAVTQYMYAAEWPILNLTLWPSGLDDSGTEEGNSHVPGTQSTAEGVFVLLGMLSRAGSRGGREWLHLCSGHGVSNLGES